jgi:two-component system cell cycle sensor histidine kinase PleC
LSEHERRPVTPDQVIEYGTLIQDSAGHLLAVINSILEISKLQSGRFSLDKRDLDIGELVRSTTASLKGIAQDRQVTLNTELEPGLPLIQADAIKLRQVITNLVSNAIKFSHPGHKVDVDCRKHTGRAVTLSVRDTGIGMSADDVRIALTPFGQVDGSRSRAHEGTGLGLPIAKGLIEMHGGTLDVESEKGKGTSVVVMLPVKANAPLEPPALAGHILRQGTAS